MDGHGSIKIQTQADLFVEFLEAAFHLILYNRDVYPAVLFKPCRLYNVTVQMSCQTEINQYIRNIIISVHSLLLQQNLDKVVLAIINTDDHSILEKFIFIMQRAPETNDGDTYLLEVEESLRGALLKITYCNSLLKPHPPNCTFTVLIHTTNEAAARLEHQQQAEGFPWIRADPSDTEIKEVTSQHVIPLTSITNKLMKVSSK
jgi:mitotic spindle assembly checkpoint protein MAD2B